MAEYYSIVYMYHSFLIHSSADGHLGCFHVLAIMEHSAIHLFVVVVPSLLSLCSCLLLFLLLILYLRLTKTNHKK